MRVLVTGGAGYIGSHTTHLLLRRGHDVIVADNLSRGHQRNVPEGRLRVLDLADTAALAKLMAQESVEAVIHFAAYIAVGESMREPELYFANNVGGSLSLFQAMRQAGVARIVFSSTAAVYGTPARTPIPEDMPYAPVSPYGESKVMVEKILAWLERTRGVRSIWKMMRCTPCAPNSCRTSSSRRLNLDCRRSITRRSRMRPSRFCRLWAKIRTAKDW